MVIKYRQPRPAGVGGFPDATVHVAEIELVGPARYSAHRVAAAASERAEHAPVETDGNVEEPGARSLGTRREERRMLRELQHRERDAGLRDTDEELSARRHRLRRDAAEIDLQICR